MTKAIVQKMCLNPNMARQFIFISAKSSSYHTLGFLTSFATGPTSKKLVERELLSQYVALAANGVCYNA